MCRRVTYKYVCLMAKLNSFPPITDCCLMKTRDILFKLRTTDRYFCVNGPSLVVNSCRLTGERLQCASQLCDQFLLVRDGLLLSFQVLANLVALCLFFRYLRVQSAQFCLLLRYLLLQCDNLSLLYFHLCINSARL